MNAKTRQSLEKIIVRYKEVMEVMEQGAKKAIRDDGRAYGGFVRMAKGKIQEYITERLIQIAWLQELGQNENRLIINSDKIRIPMRPSYVERIPDKDIKQYILTNMSKYYYSLSVDKHIFIDKKFVIGIECKAYTENAMIKRILVDFHLLKTKYPMLKCYLFQLESQLGGDYSTALEKPKGSTSTHSIMSYFSDVGLEIVTLLEGERKIDRPINKEEFFKELKLQHLQVAVEKLTRGFSEAGTI